MAWTRGTGRAVYWLVPRRLRRRWVSLAPMALVVALAGGCALLAAEVGWRTERAYPRYVVDAEVGQVEINPSLFTAEIGDAIRNLPGVRRVTTSDIYLAWPGYDGAPLRYSEAMVAGASSSNVGVFGSADGRFDSMDRLAFTSGRAAHGPNEAVVDRSAAETLGVEVGDEVPISFFDVGAELRAYAGEDPMMDPVGVEIVRVVGVATFPRAVLPDDVYGTGRLVVSPDVAARYPCDAVEPTPDFAPSPDDAPAEILTAGLPPECATSYRYWSLLVDGGPQEAAMVQEAFVRAASERNAELPPEFQEWARYLLITSTIDNVVRDVARSVQPAVAAFHVLALATATIALAALGMIALRFLRNSTDERTKLRQLGASRSVLAATEALPVGVATMCGAFGALGLAWLASPVGPVGEVRSVAVPVERGLETETIAAFAVGSAVVVALTVVLAWRAVSDLGATKHPVPSPIVARFVANTSGHPAVSRGLSSALGSRRDGRFAAALGTIAVAALVAALTFGTSLDRLLATPAWYGWPWDAAALIGAGYSSETDVDEVGERFDDLEAVESWAGLGFWQSVLVDETTVPTMVGFGGPSDLDLTVLDGRLPAEADEIAIGAHFAHDRGISVGDTVTVDGELVTIDEATVTGLIVFPSLGPLESDHTSPGRGVLLRDSALDLGGSPFRLLTFFGLRVAASADRHSVLSAIAPDLDDWDSNYSVRQFSDPVRPAPISGVDEIRLVPLVVSGVVAVAAGAALVAAIFASVRAREREIGVLRALGFTRRQVRRMVVVQSLATTGIALVFGLPLGVILGATSWRGYAGQLGVISSPTVSYAVLGAMVVGSLIAALAAAVLPARRASRTRPADLLRT